VELLELGYAQRRIFGGGGSSRVLVVEVGRGGGGVLVDVVCSSSSVERERRHEVVVVVSGDIVVGRGSNELGDVEIPVEVEGRGRPGCFHHGIASKGARESVRKKEERSIDDEREEEIRKRE